MSQATGVVLAAKSPTGPKGVSHSIGIAGMKVVHSPDTIRTVLGSCVGIAIFDRVARIGGLAHVILPDSKEGTGDPGKFGDTAVDQLLEMILSEGAERKRLAAKYAGGAAMFGTATVGNLGARNADAVQARLAHHGIRAVAKEVGGTKGRKMLLDPATGDVTVEIIGETPNVI